MILELADGLNFAVLNLKHIVREGRMVDHVSGGCRTVCGPRFLRIGLVDCTCNGKRPGPA